MFKYYLIIQNHTKNRQKQSLLLSIFLRFVEQIVELGR